MTLQALFAQAAMILGPVLFVCCTRRQWSSKDLIPEHSRLISIVVLVQLFAVLFHQRDMDRSGLSVLLHKGLMVAELRVESHLPPGCFDDAPLAAVTVVLCVGMVLAILALASWVLHRCSGSPTVNLIAGWLVAVQLLSMVSAISSSMSLLLGCVADPLTIDGDVSTLPKYVMTEYPSVSCDSSARTDLVPLAVCVIVANTLVIGIHGLMAMNNKCRTWIQSDDDTWLHVAAVDASFAAGIACLAVLVADELARSILIIAAISVLVVVWGCMRQHLMKESKLPIWVGGAILVLVVVSQICVATKTGDELAYILLGCTVMIGLLVAFAACLGSRQTPDHYRDHGSRAVCPSAPPPKN